MKKLPGSADKSTRSADAVLGYARATTRIAAAVPVLLAVGAMAVAQGFIVGPILRNETMLPNIAFNMLRRLFGIKVEFNAASAPVVKDKPVWFVSNHMAIVDAIVLGSKLNGTFAGKAEILKWPIIAQVARGVQYIGLRRNKQYNGQARAALIKNFNAGNSVIMFPEATTTDGKEVKMFHAGLITLLFGDKGVLKKKEVLLKKNVVVQPVAIRVKEVAGKNAIGNDSLRNLYSMPNNDNMLSVAWQQMQLRSMTIELTVLPPLEPTNFTIMKAAADAPEEDRKNAALQNAKALINQAALDIAAVVNPGQTTFEKAVIPGQAKKSRGVQKAP